MRHVGPPGFVNSSRKHASLNKYKSYAKRGLSELGILLDQASMADTILTTGKYLNAIRECKVSVVCPWANSAPIGARRLADSQRFLSTKKMHN